MIVDFILGVLIGTLKAVLGVLPSLPAMPTAVVTAGDWALSVVGSGVFFLKYVYGSELLLAMLAVIVVLFNFEHIYHLVIWIWRKLPLGSH